MHRTDLLERGIYHEICRRDGVKARELERLVPADRHRINQYLYNAPFRQESGESVGCGGYSLPSIGQEKQLPETSCSAPCF